MDLARILAVAAALAVSWVSIFAEQEPGPLEAPAPQAIVRKKGRDVIVTWTGGQPPFLVVREAPQPGGTESTLSYPAEKLASRTFTDRNIPEGERYWYRVFDSKAKPEIFGISPSGILGPGDPVLITGVGFSDNCQDIRVDQGGEPWRPYECSFTELRLRVPRDFVNGPLLVSSPTGTAFGFERGWNRDKAKTW